MHRFKLIALTMTAAAALAAPASSLAQGAAPDQYQEQIPGAGGGDSTGGISGSPDGSSPSGGNTSAGDTGSTGGTAANSATVQRFNGHKDGGSTADLANQTAPDSDALRNATGQGSATDGGTVFGSAANDDGSSNGLGIILIAVLVGTAAAGGGYWYWRSRRDSDLRRQGDGTPTHA